VTDCTDWKPINTKTDRRRKMNTIRGVASARGVCNHRDKRWNFVRLSLSEASLWHDSRYN
jgi:hypothetical protein